MPPILTRREEVHALRLARSQPESLVELNGFAEELKARVVEVALGDPRVRTRLNDARHRVLAVDYREEKGARGALVRFGDVCIYDYDRDVLVVASVDTRRGSVAELDEREGAAPPITEEELEEALRLASETGSYGATVRRKAARTVAFPTPSYAFDAEPERARHRGCTLFFRTGRADVGAVTVDLSARDVVPEERLPEVLRSRPGRAVGQQRRASDAR